MGLPRTLAFYVSREVVKYGGLGLVAVGILLLSGNLLRTADRLAGLAPTPGDLLTLVACLAAAVAAYAVPLAFLFGVLVALSRMSSDSETRALRAAGVGTLPVLAPVLALSLLASAATAGFTLDLEHRKKRELRALVANLATRGTLVEPGRFRPAGDRTLYARERSGDGELRGVLIADDSDPEHPLLVFAESGRLDRSDPGGGVAFRLERGDIHFAGNAAPGDRYRRIAFDAFEYRFPSNATSEAAFTRLRPRDMTLAELRAVLARDRAGTSPAEQGLRRTEPGEYRLEIHRRFALPAAPLAFALIAVPLGLGRAGRSRGAGAALCVAIAFSYYVALGFAEHHALAGRLPAAAAMWAPNALLLAVAAPLLLRTRRVR